MSFASDVIALMVRHEPKTNVRIGLSRDEVRRLTATARPVALPTALEVRTSIAKIARTTRESRAGT